MFRSARDGIHRARGSTIVFTVVVTPDSTSRGETLDDDVQHDGLCLRNWLSLRSLLGNHDAGRLQFAHWRLVTRGDKELAYTFSRQGLFGYVQWRHTVIAVVGYLFLLLVALAYWRA